MTDALIRWSDRWLWVAKLVIFLSALIVAGYAMDRRVPFKVETYEPAAGERGSPVVLRASVWRDVDRPCSAYFSRYVFDAAGTRFDLGDAAATAEMIRDMDRRHPGRLSASIVIPPTAAIGEARLVTTLKYRCNKVHSLWPVEVTIAAPFTVLQ